MSKKAGSKKRMSRNEEKLFAAVVVGMAVAVGVSFCSLLFALNHHEQSPQAAYDELPSSQPTLIPPDHPRQLVDFILTNRMEHLVTRADLDGKILVVDFLFTSCSLTCPAVNSEMAQIQQLTTNQPDVKLVSLTVDPRDDTPAVLAQYGERFGAQTNRWFFLTGDETTLYNLIGKSFLAKDTNDVFGYMPGDFSHTECIAIVDARGNLRGYFDGLNQNTPAAVVEEIAKLRNEKL